MSILVDEFVSAVEAKTGRNRHASGSSYSLHCPAHDDSHASLVVTEGDDGRVLAYCHKDCQLPDLCAAVDWEVRDLFPDETSRRSAFDIKMRYPFVDEDGTLLYEEVRLVDEGIRMRRPDGQGGWIWDLNDTRRVPYGLPRLVEAREAGDTVVFVEGPKDAVRLESLGFRSTAICGGAKGWCDDYRQYFRGLNVVLCGDHDEPGKKLVEQVGCSLHDVAASVGIVDVFAGTPLLTGHGPDVSDWLNQDGTPERLRSIIESADPWQPAIAPLTKPDGFLRTSDIAALMHRSIPSPVGDVFLRTDATGLFMSGTVGLLIGLPGAGKSWLTIEMVNQITSSGRVAVVCDWEGTDVRFAQRLKTLGASLEQGTFVRYCNPGSTPFHLIVKAFLDLDPALVVIDSFAKLLASYGLDEDRAGSALVPFSDLARPFADAGALVVIVDHVVKAADSRGGWPRGSGAKLAEADTAYNLKVVEPFDRNHSGEVELKVTKDRDSIIGPVGSCAASVRFLSNGEEGLRIVIDPPTTKSKNGSRGLSRSEGRVLAVLRGSEGRVLTTTEVLEHMAADGDEPVERRAIQNALRGLEGRHARRVNSVRGKEASWVLCEPEVVTSSDTDDVEEENAA